MGVKSQESALGRVVLILVLYGVAFATVYMAAAQLVEPSLQALLYEASTGLAWATSLLWLGAASDVLWSLLRFRRSSAHGVFLIVIGVILTTCFAVYAFYAYDLPNSGAFGNFAGPCLWVGPPLLFLGLRRLHGVKTKPVTGVAKS